jgi:ring-1,2-phenylacetyl-CoA epoxidase subunit PaaC
MVNALGELWMYTGEMFEAAPYELVDVASLKEQWLAKVEKVLREASLEHSKQTWMQSGGKSGRHTEHLGYLLAEMQYLQRAYPNATW